MNKHSANFKAQVALAAIKGDETIAELSKKFGIHPRQIQMWKSEAIKGMENIFNTRGDKNKKNDDSIAELERKIGQLTIENDFLKKNLLKFPK
jgi:transposase